MNVMSFLGLLFCISISAAAARRLPHRHTASGTSTNATVSLAANAAHPNPASGYFKNFVVAGVSGIGAALTFDKSVLLLDRTDGTNTHIKLPNGKPAYGQLITYDKKVLQPLDVLTNVFCSSGQILEDGSFISIGGTTNNPAVKILNGAADVRKFVPCNVRRNKTCGFVDAGEMTSKRWYPTSEKLPDGRVFVVGGGDVIGNLAINNRIVNNPTYEFWPRGKKEGNYPLAILSDHDNVPFTLYPFVHLLPSGHLFIFAGQLSVVLDYTKNKVVKNLPRMQAPGEEDVYRSYPVTGTSALFPLDPANKYKATILICGGNSKDATVLSIKDGNCPGCFSKATASCGSIKPDDSKPQWTWEYMPQGRVMPDAVLLLDDTILITNGAGTGFQALNPGYATHGITKPVLYDTRKRTGKRFTQINADAGIARMYHSEALLMPDGNVLLAGSNPNALATNDGPYPTIYQTQLFYPPYATWGVKRNKLTKVPAYLKMNHPSTITLTTVYPTPAGLKATDRFRVVLANPGFSTHSERHGMRNIVLPVTAAKVAPGAGGAFTVTLSVVAPPNGNIAPAGFYWLHVTDQGGMQIDGKWVGGYWVPNVEGVAIKLNR